MKQRPVWSALAIVAAVTLAVVFVATLDSRAQDGTPTSGTPCASPAAGTATPETALASASPAACPGSGTTITMMDIKFDPKAITIPANTDVIITIPNQGAAVHNFNIDELNIHSGDVAPGSSGTVTINAAPGTYQYYCAIPGHKEAGMVGTLTVQ